MHIKAGSLPISGTNTRLIVNPPSVTRSPYKYVKYKQSKVNKRNTHTNTSTIPIHPTTPFSFLQGNADSNFASTHSYKQTSVREDEETIASLSPRSSNLAR